MKLKLLLYQCGPCMGVWRHRFYSATHKRYKLGSDSAKLTKCSSTKPTLLQSQQQKVLFYKLRHAFIQRWSLYIHTCSNSKMSASVKDQFLGLGVQLESYKHVTEYLSIVGSLMRTPVYTIYFANKILFLLSCTEMDNIDDESLVRQVHSPIDILS